MAAVIFSGEKVRALKSALQLGFAATISSGSVNPSVDGFDAVQGDVYISVTEKKIYQKTGPMDTDWTAVLGSNYTVNKITLNSTDITNKYVTLTASPSTPDLTRLVVINGLEQDYGPDFEVTTNQLTWDSLNLDGVLEEGDKLVVVYS